MEGLKWRNEMQALFECRTTPLRETAHALDRRALQPLAYNGLSADYAPARRQRRLRSADTSTKARRSRGDLTARDAN